MTLSGRTPSVQIKRVPLPAMVAARRLGVLPSRFFFQVNLRTQSAALLEQAIQFIPRPVKLNTSLASRGPQTAWYYLLRQRYRISTSRFGIGQVSGSNCTPLGLHRVAEKIGGGLPVGAVFKSRRHIGYTWQGLPQATIAHRIMWLEGLEPGFNRGGDVDTHARYIYIHGLADEPTLGRPASHGCIHLAANDLLPLYDRLPSGTLVWIEA